jgi:diaminopimelate decarboxylase
MIASNELNYEILLKIFEHMTDLLLKLEKELKISFEYLNIGGNFFKVKYNILNN